VTNNVTNTWRIEEAIGGMGVVGGGGHRAGRIDFRASPWGLPPSPPPPVPSSPRYIPRPLKTFPRTPPPLL
jgi:hypothetical protein